MFKFRLLIVKTLLLQFTYSDKEPYLHGKLMGH